jgi:hypothetical protein
MPENVPDEFHSDEEIADWFENADLSEYLLEKAAGVHVASHVTLTIEDDLSASRGPATAAAASDSKLTPVR